MSKKLIIGFALAVVLVSGSYFSAQAACGFGCFHLSMPSCLSCAAARDADKAQQRDADKPDINQKPGSYQLGVPNVQQGDQ